MNQWIRQFHRWMSVAFVLAVVVTSIVLSRPDAPMWINYISLPPLGLLALTGIYLFALPYLAKWRGARRAQGG